MKITIQELSKSFGGRDIFNNFSLEVDSGERLCVCGPNGTGKSTLLRSLNLLEQPTSGAIYFDGADLADKSVNIDLHRQNRLGARKL